ncbi:MAG: calcium-binding protein [Baekduia sp.]
MNRATLTSAVVSACIGAAALPAAASAAINVTVSGANLTASGTAAGDLTVATISGTDVFVVGDTPVTSSSATCSATTHGGQAGIVCTRSVSGTVFSAITVDLSGSTQPIDAVVSYPLNKGPIQLTLGSGDDSFLVEGSHDPAALITVLGGDGDDDLTGSSIGDTLDGQGGDDLLQGGNGNDTLRGGAGNDAFSAESSVDGADSFDGGTDVAATDEYGRSGDSISYENRTTATTVSLPADAVSTPAGNNGATGENDKIARIENVYGSRGNNTITGNERANQIGGGYGVDLIDGKGGDDTVWGSEGNDTVGGGEGDDALYGDEGADRLDGAGGADYVFARDDERDTLIDCGTGSADYVMRDYNDPSASGCEKEAPGFTRDPEVTGSLVVGQTVAISTAEIFGTVTATDIAWYSYDERTDDFEVLGSGPTLVLTDRLVGKYVVADVSVTDGISDANGFAVSNGVVAAGGTGGAGGNPTPSPPQLPPTPPGLLELATAALGTGTAGVPLANVTTQVSLFRSLATAGSTIRYRRGSTIALYGIGCQATCTTRSRLRLTIKPTGRRKKAVKVTLPFTKTVPAQGTIAVTSLRLSSKQAALVKRSRSTTLTIELVVIGLPDSHGVPLTIKRVHRLKIA